MGHQSYKTPTSLLVDNNGKFKAFGYAAEKAYGDAVEVDDCAVVEDDESFVSDLHLFKHFKMDLHGKKKLDRSVRIKATDDKYLLPAVDVFGMALKYLKDHLIAAVNQTVKSQLKEEQIRWVLTVPAIWSEVAKNFMKEAAVKGRLVDKVSSPNLVIALEPEAASLYCRTKDISQFIVDDSSGEVKKQQLGKGDKYMVVDAGGGTMDITVHEVQEEGKVKELHRASGGPWGGIYVDEKLTELFVEVLGEKVIFEFRKTHPNQWMTLLLDWEVKKKSAKPGTETPISLTISANFASFFEAKTGKPIHAVIKEKTGCGVKFQGGHISISKEKIAAMFDHVLSPTMHHLKDLLSKPQVKDLKCIFVVGGFGESPFLQERIRSELETARRTVLIPIDASLCVIKGAVQFGLSPHAITSRIARRTFCFRTTKPKKDGIKYNKSQLNEDGSRIRYLRPLVKKNEEVADGDVRTITTRPVNKVQNTVKFTIFTADSEEVNDPGAEDVDELGELVINVDPVKGNATNEIELMMQFGGTSLKVTAKHKATGKTQVADFNRPDA